MRLRIAVLSVAAFVSVLAAFGQRQPASSSRATPLASDVPDSCPVTKPPIHPFVPPSPYSPAKPMNGFWFGKPTLWTLLPSGGTLREANSSIDSTFREKLFWWRQGLDWRAEHKPKLRVSGKRLDSPAPSLLADQANYGWQRKEQPFMVVGINFPTLGCWEITGHYPDEELTFVVWVWQ